MVVYPGVLVSGGVLVNCVNLTSTVSSQCWEKWRTTSVYCTPLHVLRALHFTSFLLPTSCGSYTQFYVHLMLLFCDSYTPLHELLIFHFKWFYTPLHGRLTLHFIFLHSTSYASYTPLHELLTLHFMSF